MLNNRRPAPTTADAPFLRTVTSFAETQRPPSPAPRIMKSRTAPKRVRTPNCTHITMERVHLGDSGECGVCGRVPSLGFLYECRQDRDSSQSESASVPELDSANQTSKSDLRRELEKLGLGESVIVTAEQGKYTDAQLGKLRALKLELNQAIADVAHGNRINDPASKLMACAKGPSNIDGASSSLPAKATSIPRCFFRACHTCRPYFKDRIYISFNAVFSNDFLPVTPDDAAVLPTKSAEVARQIGLAQSSPRSATPEETSPSTLLSSDFILEVTPTPSSRSSVLTFKTTQSDVDDTDLARQHRRRFYKMGHRSSGDIAREISRLPLFARRALKTAFQGVFRPSRESSSSGSNITLPMPRTGAARSFGDGPSAIGEFDMGALRRVRRQKERNDLRLGMLDGGFEGVSESSNLQVHVESAQSGDDQDVDGSSESDFTVYSCASERGEVEVEGGVALTEEAVETHTPDILSDALPSEFGGDVQEEMLDLVSLMTQV